MVADKKIKKYKEEVTYLLGKTSGKTISFFNLYD